jgi:hypothetical protein
MPTAHPRWTVLPHGPIEKLEENLWRVKGALPNMALERVMTLARMADGRVVVHSAIALTDDEMREVEAWGEPAFLVVPNGWHRLDAPSYKNRYPSLRVVCPRGARKAVEKVLAVDLTYDEFPGDVRVSLEHAPGTKDGEGVMRVRGDGLTVVFNDLIFNLPHGRGLAGLIFRLMGSTGGPRVTRMGRLFVVRDRRALRAYLENLATEPDLARVIVSHGAPIVKDVSDVLRGIAGTL